MANLFNSCAFPKWHSPIINTHIVYKSRQIYSINTLHLTPSKLAKLFKQAIKF